MTSLTAVQVSRMIGTGVAGFTANLRGNGGTFTDRQLYDLMKLMGSFSVPLAIQPLHAAMETRDPMSERLAVSLARAARWACRCWRPWPRCCSKPPRPVAFGPAVAVRRDVYDRIGGHGAVREACELIMHAQGSFEAGQRPTKACAVLEALAVTLDRDDQLARQRVHAAEEACGEKDSCRLLDTFHSLMGDGERGAHRRRTMVRHQVGIVRRQERLEGIGKRCRARSRIRNERNGAHGEDNFGKNTGHERLTSDRKPRGRRRMRVYHRLHVRTPGVKLFGLLDQIGQAGRRRHVGGDPALIDRRESAGDQ